MNERFSRPREGALALPPYERAALAADLLASLDGQPDADAEAAWVAEIEHRRQQALAGQAATIDWDVAGARLEAGLRRP
jgi:hypothetical protein